MRKREEEKTRKRDDEKKRRRELRKREGERSAKKAKRLRFDHSGFVRNSRFADLGIQSNDKE